MVSGSVCASSGFICASTSTVHICLANKPLKIEKTDGQQRAVAKILPAQENEHSSTFCDKFKQRPNFASTFEMIWDHSIPLERGS